MFPKGQSILIIGADTVVVQDNQILEKPRSPEHACQMLGQLSGKTHEVFTGVFMVSSPSLSFGFITKTAVTMRSIEQQEIMAYVASGEPMDKAGSYALQGCGATFVQEINGSHTNVIGLPLCELSQHLQEKFDFKVFG